MNIDNTSESVISEYFAGHTAMDESLSDFQEVKKKYTGPKPVQKPNKSKTRKATKQIKGQKDIRTALKGNKNELVSYSKEFSTVCKKSGLDVDAEQLQLAIALSKSLQTESTNSPESSQALSSQERVAKIRKTLQEFGFKVPDSKITINKKTKKCRKQYKLLTLSEEEKQQNITQKYSQIIFENNSRLSPNSSIDHVSKATVFSIAANIPYQSMKDNNIFYVEGLIEISTTTGSLLRDWSEIPGRPESPKLFNTNTINFKDMDCSQDELDVVLSGSFKAIQSIISSKEIKHKSKYEPPKLVLDDDRESIHNDKNKHPLEMDVAAQSPVKIGLQTKSPIKTGIGIKSPIKVLSPNNEDVEIKSPSKEILVNRKLFEEHIALETINKLTVCTQQYRSCSPDIFDEDFSFIMDNTKPINILSQEHNTKVFTKDNFMDLTQCTNIVSSQNTDKTSQLSQNITKRNSNDLMEMTECVVGLSQPIRENVQEIDLPQDRVEIIQENQRIHIHDDIENLSLSLSPNIGAQNLNASISLNIDDEQNETILTNQIKHTDSIQMKEHNIDLTQSSNEDDKIISVIEENDQEPNKDFESMDLTQSSNSNDINDLPLVHVSGSQTQETLEDTIIINEELYITNGKVKKSMILENKLDNVFDLTQAQENHEQHSSSSVEKSEELCSASFYEDFVHDHSETTGNSTESGQNLPSKHDNSSHSAKSSESNDIDLTQGSDTDEILISPRPVTLFQNIPKNSSLGKKDDVSIDYDEILIDDDNIGDKESSKENDKSNTVDLKYGFSKSEAYDDTEIVYANDDDIKSSQNSQAFNISDKELDYSLHKSRHNPRDNFDLGGISVMDNVTTLGSFRKSLSERCHPILATNKNTTMEDSFLPEVNIKKTDDKFKHTTLIDLQNSKASSPIKVQEVLKSNNGIINIKTPKNTEYVIKTDDVTPMADYKSMSTPQRNKELDKYGLKPFKRKRAIQILTHLYNQTHPTIQQLVDEDQPSPSKKPRHETYTQHTTPMKVINQPNSPLKSPLKRRDIEIHSSPRKTKGLKRDGGILCAPSPKRTDGMNDECNYEVTSETADIKSVDCCPDDWVFQKREKAKVHSCRVPLHIAFHNYVLSRCSLREAILKYEPVNIDVIHKDLVGYGHRYDPKDLLKFLDKKCITVKTTDNNSRNNKR